MNQFKILSADQIEEISKTISNVDSSLSDYKTQLDLLIKNFEGSEIVQSLFEVGSFGKEQQQKVIEIRAAIDEFYNLICQDGGLVAKTKQFLVDAQSLNESGKM